MKRVVSAAAARLGYSIFPSWRISAMPLERHLRQLFRHHSINVVLDVGANSGQYRDFLRDRVGFAGVIHSFEPQPLLSQVMQEASKKDGRWHVHGCALGSKSADMTLHVAARDTFSSFREPEVDGSPQFASSVAVSSDIVVPVCRLDDLTLEGMDGAIYLKCDTQGFDLEVIKGAERTLKRIRAMQFELAFRPLYAGVPPYQEVLAYVGDQGFDVSAFFPVSSEADLRAIEMDCVMVRRPNR